MERYFRDIDERFDYGNGVEVVAGHPQKAFIKEYVVLYDNDFYEPLSARVDMEVFSQKLSDLSTTFVIFKDGEVAGLICAYFYQPETKKGFITLVHTKHEYRGRHLSLPLLESVKQYATKRSFERIGLFVSKQQTSAYNLYSHHGFVTISEEENGRCQMECKLKNMKTLLITGIGGLTPRSIATIIREKYPHYHVIGIDADKKAMGFFMYTNGKKLVDEYYVCPRCDNPEYFPFIEKLVAEKHIDYAFVEPEAEIVVWGEYFEKHGMFPVETFMGCKLLSESLRDKAIMASLLEGTDFIPKTIKVTQSNPRFEDVAKEIGFPCWIRATEGTGGLGSLRLDNLDSYKSWLFINSRIEEFTVSEFLTGRHLANQMLYYNNEYVKGAALECAEYVMANAAPSHVTGNTHFARFLNEDRINKFCNDCIKYLCDKLQVPAHGILSFDLKEDKNGNLKVTEVNIRHMAYTGVMARVGFDLISDTMTIMEDGNTDRIVRDQYHHYDKPYIFLRDVDVEPIVLESEEIFENMKG